MLKYAKNIVLILFIFLSYNFIHVSNANTATINAASCSQSDVQAAINTASDGDIVKVPPGTCKWTSTVTIPNIKGISLQGAGIDSTIIQDGVGATASILDITTSNSNEMVRVTGFTFDNEGQAKSGLYSQIYIDGDAQQFRIDHCKIDDLGTTGRGIIIYSTGGSELYGVIDNCTFNAPRDGSIQGLAVFGGAPHDDAAWGRALTLGTDKAVYIEDCTFNYSYDNDGVLNAYGGARFVLRYCTVYGTLPENHGCDSGEYRSTFSYEIYENTFNADGVSVSFAFENRGGTGVVYNNTWTSGYRPACLRNLRSCSSYNYWGICDGNNVLDGNEETNGYPCLDQIGRTTGQALSPLYEWGNTLAGGDFDFSVVGSCVEESIHIQEGRDYYNDTQRPGYSAYTYPHPLTKPSYPKNFSFQ
jgi:hypothetical protein